VTPIRYICISKYFSFTISFQLNSMKQFLNLKGLFLLLLLGWSRCSFGQTVPTHLVTMGSVNGACVGDTVTIPVTLSGVNIPIGAISMSVFYDTTVLLCLSNVTNINPIFQGSALSNCGNFSSGSWQGQRRQFRFAWYSLNSISPGVGGSSGLLFNMRFVVLAPTSTSGSPLTWDFVEPGNCELADSTADIINIPQSSWLNGSVTTSSGSGGLVQFTNQPNGVLGIFEGGNTTLSASTTGNPSFQWQVLTVGGSWTNLSNNSIYSGVNSNTLTISSAPRSLNGTQYRLNATGCGGVPLSSNSVTLSVFNSNSVGFTSSNRLGCQGDTVNVPINIGGVGFSSNLTAFTLKLMLPSGTTYLGLTNTAQPFVSLNATMTGTNLNVVWSGTLSSAFVGTLTDVRVILPNQSGYIVWDTTSFTVPAISAYTFTTTSLHVNPLPTVISSPASTILVGEFSDTTLSVVSSGTYIFQWQKQGAIPGTWVDLTDGSVFSGTSSPQLSIRSVTMALSGARFRLKMIGVGCSSPVYSPNCSLSVIPINVRITAHGTVVCSGDTALVPVRIIGANQIGYFNMFLRYNSSSLNYLGFDNALPNITVQIQGSPSRVEISYQGVGLNLPSDTILRLRFRALNSASLTWTGIEFANVNGDTLALSQITRDSTGVSVTEAIITPVGPTAFCVGGSVLLNGNIVSGASYQWFNGASIIQGATNTSYTAFTSGTYRFFLSIPGGCTDTSNQIVVSTSTPPNAAISLVGNNTICQGQSVGLVASPRGNGFTYRWYRNSNRIMNLPPNQDSIGALLSGTYQVVVTNLGNCSDSTATGVVVTVNPKPRPPSISRPTAPPASDSLYANIRNQNNITWFRNGVALTGGSNGAILISGNGIYRAVQDSNGCRSDSSNSYLATGVSVLEHDSRTLQFELYPNPTTGNVTFLADFDQIPSPGTFVLLNPIGQVLKSSLYQNIYGRFELDVDLGQLSPGVYFVMFKRQGKVGILRLIKN